MCHVHAASQTVLLESVVFAVWEMVMVNASESILTLVQVEMLPAQVLLERHIGTRFYGQNRSIKHEIPHFYRCAGLEGSRSIPVALSAKD